MATQERASKAIISLVLLNNITTLITRPDSIDDLRTEDACLMKYVNFTKTVFHNIDTYCNAVFDQYLCWPPTKPGIQIQQHCPAIRLSDPTRYASRRCRENGIWETLNFNETSSKGWTNYTNCFPPDIQNIFVEGFNDNKYYLTKYAIAQKSRYIEITGYVVSFIAVIAALYIFTFRNLQSLRNLIHRQVFYSILCQTVIHLIIFCDQFITRESIGIKTTSYRLTGIDNTVIVCEVLYIVAEYSVSAVFSWIFIEGLHLNYLVSNNVLRPFNFQAHCICGWIAPCLLTLIWALVVWLSYRREYVKVCWFGYNLKYSYWILQGPRLAIILCNAVILVKVLKAVIKKLKEARTADILKIRKSVKAALFLLPILGLSNVLSTFDVPIRTNTYIFMVFCYTRQFLKSFQGLLLTLVYCVGNEEVRMVVIRRMRHIWTNGIYRQALIRWFRPRQQATNSMLATSSAASRAPPTRKETIPSTQQGGGITEPPTNPTTSSVEMSVAIHNCNERLKLKMKPEEELFVSETSFTDVTFTRQLDSYI